MINKKGSGLLEIVIVVSLVALVVAASTSAAQLYLTYSMRNINNVKAGYLLEEGIEASKVIRDRSWITNIQPLPIGSTRYILFQGGTWTPTTTPSLVDSKFVRTVQFNAAYRNPSADFASTGTLDPDAKLVTVTVSWPDPVTKVTTTKTLSTYLINLFDN